jgi:CRP-like cAMP-binding protein
MNKSLIHLALREYPILKALTPMQMDILVNSIEFVKVSKNKLVYDINTETGHVYLVEKGSIKLAMLSSTGRTMAKDIIYSQEIFNENVFSSDNKSKEYAEAISDTQLFRIPVTVFKDLIVQNPIFADSIMGVIVLKLQKLEERLQNFVFCKAKERVIDFLYKTGKRKGQKIGFNECLIEHGMSHREISYLTDTSRQTVARILNELKKDNLVHFTSRTSGRILIRDLDDLWSKAALTA